MWVLCTMGSGQVRDAGSTASRFFLGHQCLILCRSGKINKIQWSGFVGSGGLLSGEELQPSSHDMPTYHNMVLLGKAWSHYTRLAPTLSTWQGCLGVLIIVFDVTALPVGSTLNAWSWSRGMGVVG